MINNSNFSYAPDRLFDLGIPIGSIVLFPGEIYDGADESGNRILKESLRIGGWMEANGELLNTVDYQELYAVIGSGYNIGSEASTTFRLPDLRGLFVRGTQNSPRNDPNREKYDDKDAVNGKRLNYTSLTYEKPSETTELVGTLQNEDLHEHQHEIKGIFPVIGGTASSFQVMGNNQQVTTPPVKTENTGGIETRPNNIAMYYLIKTRNSRWKSNLNM